MKFFPFLFNDILPSDVFLNIKTLYGVMFNHWVLMTFSRAQTKRDAQRVLSGGVGIPFQRGNVRDLFYCLIVNCSG